MSTPLHSFSAHIILCYNNFMKLLFVYNAKSGKTKAALDIAHKIISPSTYSCDLCSLTHGIFSEKSAWKEFVGKADVEMLFYHIDEFEEKYGSKADYPLILREEGETLEPFMDKDEIAGIEDVKGLIKLIEKKLKK